MNTLIPREQLKSYENIIITVKYVSYINTMTNNIFHDDVRGVHSNGEAEDVMVEASQAPLGTGEHHPRCRRDGPRLGELPGLRDGLDVSRLSTQTADCPTARST